MTVRANLKSRSESQTGRITRPRLSGPGPGLSGLGSARLRAAPARPCAARAAALRSRQGLGQLTPPPPSLSLLSLSPSLPRRLFQALPGYSVPRPLSHGRAPNSGRRAPSLSAALRFRSLLAHHTEGGPCTAGQPHWGTRRRRRRGARGHSPTGPRPHHSSAGRSGCGPSRARAGVPAARPCAATAGGRGGPMMASVPPMMAKFTSLSAAAGHSAPSSSTKF